MLAPPACEHVRASDRAQPHLAAAQELPTPKCKSLSAANKPNRPRRYTTPPDADIPEKIFSGLRPALSGFVNLRGGQRFREGQFRIFHHAAPHQRNEQHAQNAAHHDQRGRFPIRDSAARNEGHALAIRKAGDRENRSRCDRLADRACGSGNILFQQRPFPRSHGRHRDHGRRIRRRDSNAGSQTQVSVGRTQHNVMKQPEQDCPPGELFHLHGFGHIRNVLFLAGNLGCWTAHGENPLGRGMKANLSCTVSPDRSKAYNNKGTAHLSTGQGRMTSVGACHPCPPRSAINSIAGLLTHVCP